jgi:lipoate-protein ligase A
MPEMWRLITDSPLSGSLNMATDEAILRAVGAGKAPPTLRLYGWSPACLSLGYGQPATDADLSAIAAQGWHIVRRPTGGRAILHIDELTYAVCLPADHPLAHGSIVESYRRLSDGLLAMLRRLSPQATIGADRKAAPNGGSRPAPNPVCFEVPSDYEITADGKKLIGSAQARAHGGLLQHGAIPLHGDIARICTALAYPDSAARARAAEKVRRRAVPLSEALGRPITWAEAAEALHAAFAETFGITFAAGALTQLESAMVAELVVEKYGDPGWVLRG